MQVIPKKYQEKDLLRLNQSFLSRRNLSSQMILHFYPFFSSFTEEEMYRLYLKDFYFKFLCDSLDYESQFLFVPFQENFSYLLYLQDFFKDRKKNFLTLGNLKNFYYLESEKKQKKKKNNLKYQSFFHESVLSLPNESDFPSFLKSEFLSLFKKWEILVKKQIGYWSFSLQCNIPLEHVVFKNETVQNYEIKYFVEGKGTAVSIFTSQLDSIFWDVAFLVHPKDKRYKNLIWKNVLVPIIKRSIPVVADETVDALKNNGIKRVNPFISDESIALAEKHHLPLNVRIFDETGIYTEFTGDQFMGKPREQFKSNVFNFLEDYVQLGETVEMEEKIPYFSVTWERLYPYALDQLTLNFSQEKEKFLASFYEKSVTVSESFPEIFEHWIVLWNLSHYGERIPLMKKDDVYIPMEFPFQLHDYETEEAFVFDQLIFVLYSQYSLSDTLIFDKFINFLSSLKGYLFDFIDALNIETIEAKNQISQLFWDLFHGVEWSLEKIIDLVEHSKLMNLSQTMGITFSYFQKENLSFPFLVFSDPSLKAFYAIFAQKQGISFQPVSFLSENELSYYIMLSLLQLHYFWMYSENLETYTVPSILWKKLTPKSLETFIETEWDDAIRLALLIDHDLNVAKKYSSFLKTLRNSIRYYQQNYSFSGTFEDAIQQFNEWWDDLDVWLVSEMLSLHQEISFCNSYHELLKLFPNFETFVQGKFLSWYFEIKKDSQNSVTHAVSFLCFVFILSFLEKFVPTFVRSLYENLWWNSFKFTPFELQKSRSSQPVFIYEIFSHIDCLKKRLKLPKWAEISLYVKASPQSLDLFKQYEEVFCRKFVVNDVQLLKLHEDDPVGYEQEIFGTTIIGMQPHLSGTVGKKKTIEEMQERLKKLEQEEMYYRNLCLQWDASSWEKSLKIKEEKEKLALEIQKKRKNLE